MQSRQRTSPATGLAPRAQTVRGPGSRTELPGLVRGYEGRQERPDAPPGSLRRGVLAYDAGSIRADIFGRVILPFLRSRRIFRVDALVISHDDSDHNSGVPAFLGQFNVTRYCAPRSLVARERISLRGAEVEVLWPAFPEELSDNDASTVLRIRTGGTSILLTGDLEEEGFEGLLKTGADLKADILVLPHHGRPNHAAKQLIDAVRPRILISSNGPNEPLDPAWHSALQTREKGALVIRPGPRVTSFR